MKNISLYTLLDIISVVLIFLSIGLMLTAGKSYRMRKINFPLRYYVWIISLVLLIIIAALNLTIYFFHDSPIIKDRLTEIFGKNFSGNEKPSLAHLSLLFGIILLALALNIKKIHNKSGYHPILLEMVFKNTSNTMMQITELLTKGLTDAGLKFLPPAKWGYDLVAQTQRYLYHTGSARMVFVKFEPQGWELKCSITIDVMDIVLRNTNENFDIAEICNKIIEIIETSKFNTELQKKNLTYLEAIA